MENRLLARGRSATTLPILVALMLGTGPVSGAQAAGQGPPDFTGRWTYDEQGERVLLDLRHDVQTGTVSGVMTMLGIDLPLEGRARGASLVIERMNGVPLAINGGSMTGQLEGATLAVTITAAGEPPNSMRMTRLGRAAQKLDQYAARKVGHSEGGSFYAVQA